MSPTSSPTRSPLSPSPVSSSPLSSSLGLLVAASLFGALALAPRAAAADLDSSFSDVPSLPQQVVTFGSGWYVRGDIAATDLPQPTVSPSAVGTAPEFQFSNKHVLGYDGSLGGGYAFTNSFRIDVTGDILQSVHATSNGSAFRCQNGYNLHGATGKTSYGIIGYSANGKPIYGTVITTTPAYATPTNGTCTGAYQARIDAYDLLVNGYYDIGTFYGITPYVGAGVGLSLGRYSTAATYTQADTTSYNVNITNPVSNQTYHIDYDRASSGTYYTFSYALMAGFSYQFYSHLLLDVGYRYLDLGKIEGQHYYAQEGRVGLRYMIDN